MFLSEHEAFGGVESRCRALARSFLRLGHAVDFGCFEENVYGDLLAEYPGQCRTLPAPASVRHQLTPGALLHAWRFLREYAPDGLFFCNAELPRFLPYVLMARSAGVRRVVVHHGNEAYVPPPVAHKAYLGGLVPGLGLWRKKLLWRGRLGYSGVTHALFNNLPQQQAWVDHYRYPRARTRLWLPPIDLVRFQAAHVARGQTRKELGLEGARVVGGVGRLVPQKGFDILLQAFALVRRSSPDAMLLLVGGGPEAESLRRLAGELRVTDAVRFMGPVKDVSRVMAALDVFALSSVTPNESLGIVIVEAMACGVPTTVTDLPGPKRLVENGNAGLVVPPGDPVALAAAMARLLAERVTREQLTERGLRRAQECDELAVGNDLLAWIGGGVSPAGIPGGRACRAEGGLGPATACCTR